ncbi:MAG: hypothetical protein JO202_14915 [Ktedonobacteraceae bacterium]|nr:hypothetical protein [Ktedonobacteraceae bacterium]
MVMDRFYTAKEAQERLGASHDKFQYMVRSGQVRKVTLPGRKYGVYPKEQINRLAAAMEATAELYAHDASVFELATEADLPEIYKLVKASGLVPTPMKTMRAWIRRNPESFYTLRDNGVVVAYACIFPVQHDWLMRVLKDEIRIGSVPIGDIYPFTPDQPFDLYIRDLVIGRGEKGKAAHYAQRMIFELVHVFSELGARGIEIRAIYAFATTPQGNNICQRLRFVPLVEFNPKIKGEMPYKLDIPTTSSPLIDTYKRNLERYQAQQQSEHLE